MDATDDLHIVLSLRGGEAHKDAQVVGKEEGGVERMHGTSGKR